MTGLRRWRSALLFRFVCEATSYKGDEDSGSFFFFPFYPVPTALFPPF